jgi:hypothetical protein
MNERCIVVEGPERRGDAAFIGAWLTVAAKANAAALTCDSVSSDGIAMQ